DHGRPELQRRMARNAEILFWSNLPFGWLLLAVLPHAAFTLAQAAHRLARGRCAPFAQGKLDALRLLPSLSERRRRRSRLAAQAADRPHFPLRLAAAGDVRGHINRPRSQTSQVA